MLPVVSTPSATVRAAAPVREVGWSVCRWLVEAHLCGAQSESVLLSEQVDTETVTGLCSDSRRRFKREVCGVFVSFDAA